MSRNNAFYGQDQKAMKQTKNVRKTHPCHVSEGKVFLNMAGNDGMKICLRQILVQPKVIEVQMEIFLQN